tara:strand:- start:1122 stop:1409 length:288 start_codon:yes stop_codon:yes gene_type:complete
MYLFNIDVDDYTLIMINDILRLLVIQVSVQIMFYMKNNNVDLVSTIFLENLLFILLGVFIYWFVFNKVIKIENKKKNNDEYKSDILQKYQEIYNL